MNEILNLLNPWWFKKSFNEGIIRHQYLNKLTKSLQNKRATLLVGSRRTGKTTLIFQLISRLLKKVNSHHIFYVLVDHPQLSNFSLFDLVKEYRSFFNLDRDTFIYLFFDEIQYHKDWEKEIKALIDTEKVKIFLSGSASSQLLLKGSYLTGRIEKIEVFPLDFYEFLNFKKAQISEVEDYKYEKYFREYLKIGGYPEYVLEKDPLYFSDLVNNILYKDIVSLYQIRNPNLLKDLFLLISDRVGHHTTYNKLAAILSLKNDTVKEYLFYLKNTFLISELPRYSKNRGQIIYGPKKFYLNDNGMLFHLLGKMSYSAAFEQTLFHYLRLTYKKIGFYYENNKEADFIVEKNGKLELWEAKFEINKNFIEEKKFYLEIAKKNKISKIVFITFSKKGKETNDNIQIEFIPLWYLLIKNSKKM